VDLSKANTQAFAHFNSFHERLNRSVKTAAVAYIILEDDIAKGRRSVASITRECYALRTLWGGMPDWNNDANAIEAVHLAAHDLGAAGVIKAFSAFDVFMETLDGEINTWKSRSMSKVKPRRTSEARTSDAKGGGCPQDDAADEAEPNTKVLRFFERQGWDTGDVGYLLPIYTYFRLLRNCVAHADARATPALQAASQADVWKRSIVEWDKKTTDLTLPTPLVLTAGTEITITYKEAILASSMLRSLAWNMSRRAIALLGETGVLFVLVSRILRDRTGGLVGGKQHLSKLHHHLKSVYRIENLTIADTTAKLKELKLWEDWKDWHETMITSENKKDRRAAASPSRRKGR
jgi:hypothetical protein